MLNRSHLFVAYNQCKRMVRQGQLKTGRVNRALGIALSSATINHIQKCGTAATSCGCPDRQYRGSTCEGMVAASFRDVVS